MKESREGQEKGQRKTTSRRGSLRDSDSLQGGKDHTARLPGLGENRRWEEQVGNQRPPCTLWRSNDQGQGGLGARDAPH